MPHVEAATSSDDRGDAVVAQVHASRQHQPRDQQQQQQHQQHRQNSSSGDTGDTPSTPVPRPRRSRDSWLDSTADLNASVDGEEPPIHDQIKRGIMGFVENEIRTTKSPAAPVAINTLSAYVNECEENPRSSRAHKERKSPSKRRKKRASKHRELIGGSDFDITASSMSALEKVDDYLREYNRAEEITLSGELEIDPNDLVNNNGGSSKLKPRRTRRKSRHDEGKRERSANLSRDISPRVFDPATGKHGGKSPITKPVRPTLDLSSMLDDLGSDATSYNERHIDNPFSSPSPMTSPNCGTLDRQFGSAGDKMYVQRGGTFRAVARDRVLGESQRRADERKYFRLSSLTPLDVAISAQGGWRGIAALCHGLLAGLALMHLLAVCYGDGASLGHLSFHAAIILPYSAAYYFLCTCCLVSVFDSLEICGFPLTVHLHLKGLILAFLYIFCMLLTLSSRKFDELMAFQYDLGSNITHLETNATLILHSPPEFYSTWTHLSVWRAVIPMAAAIFVALVRQEDLIYRELTRLLQFKHSLQSIGE